MNTATAVELDTPISRAIDHLRTVQTAKGSWKGDYSGPLFLPNLYVLAHHATGVPLEQDVAEGFIAYLRHVQSEDGGFGLGEENPSIVFTTSVNYVLLRHLGVDKDDPMMARARRWMRAQGGGPHGGGLGALYAGPVGALPLVGGRSGAA